MPKRSERAAVAWSAPRLARVRERVQGFVERGAVPGVVALMSRRGETHVEVLGTMAVDGAPMQRDSIFRISSMTKPITAAAAMMLVEDGAVHLDDAVDHWLPELADQRVLTRPDGPIDDSVRAKRAITVRDLLTFRMGTGIVLAPPDSFPIQRAMTDLSLAQGPPAPDAYVPSDEWIRRLGTLPLMYQPGERWMYSTGSDVLGVLIARVSGKSFAAFLRERVFEPLGMKDTGFSVPASSMDRFTASYWTTPRTGELVLYDAARDGQWSHEATFASGAAGLVSTADDYFAFSAMLASGGLHGGERILSRRSIELMTVDHLTPNQKACAPWVPGFFDSRGWGFGMAVTTRRTELFDSVGTVGWDGGMGSAWRMDPVEDVTTILLTPASWTSPIAPAICVDFWTAVYQALAD